MSWKTESLIDWIQGNVPSWSQHAIRNLEQDYPQHPEQKNGEDVPGVLSFVYLTERTVQDIDPLSIVGQWDHYAGQTWMDALLDPQWRPGKIQSCLNEAECNPEYYFEPLKGIHLTSYDGKNWYTHMSGNHRTIIGKFLLDMASSKINKKLNFKGLSTTRHFIDHEYLDKYEALSKLIEDKVLAISLTAKADPKENTGQTINNKTIHEYEAKIFVYDSRMGDNAVRYEWLSAREFCKYAKWVLDNNGQYPMWYRVKDFMGLIPDQKLDYPDKKN